MRAFTRMVTLLVVALVLTANASAIAAPTWLAPERLADGDSGVADVALAPDGGAVVVWSTGTHAIQAASRAPGGAWSAPATLGAGTVCCPEAQVAIDPSGRAIAVYDSCTNTPSFSCDVYARTLAPGAASWSAPQEVSADAQFPMTPKVAVDAAGNAIIAWIDRNGGVYNVHERYRSSAGTLDAGVSTLSPNGGCCPLLTVAMSANGTGFVTWSQYPNFAQGYVQARTRSAAGIWSPALASGPDLLGGVYNGALAYDPEVAADALGNALVAWQTDTGLIVARARSTAGIWGPEQPLSAAASQNNSPAFAAMDADGLATVTWCEKEASGWVVKVRRRPVGAPFAPAVSLSEPGGTKCEPRVSAGPGGAAVVLWTVAGGLVRGNIRPLGGDFGAARDISVLGGSQYASGAFDAAGNAIAAWHRGNRVEAAAFDATPPVARDLVVAATATTGAPVSMSVNPFDTWSTVSASWSFGDNATGTGASTSHAYAAAGRYDVRVTLTDAVGNSTSDLRSVVVSDPPKPAELDADGDGFRASQDCDDSNPAIRPGGREIPGNKIDEDCNGIAEPTPRITAGVSWNGKLDRRRRTVFDRLRATDLPSNVRAQLRCRGKRCPFTKKTAKRRGGSTVNLLRVLGRKRPLAPGLTLEVWLQAPDTIGKVVRFKTNRRKFPAGLIMCLPVGETRPQRKCA